MTTAGAGATGFGDSSYAIATVDTASPVPGYTNGTVLNMLSMFAYNGSVSSEYLPNAIMCNEITLALIVQYAHFFLSCGR